MKIKIPYEDNNLIVEPPRVQNYSPAAVRALDLAEYFSKSSRPLRAHEIVKNLQWQASSASQLLKSLVSSAYLIFNDRTKLYVPGPRLLKIFFSPTDEVRIDNFGWASHLKLLRDLSTMTNKLTVLLTRYGGMAQIIDAVTVDNSFDQFGFTHPLDRSPAGLTLLSLLSPEEFDRVTWRYRLGSARGEVADADLLEKVRDIASAGFCASSVRNDSNIVTLGMPKRVFCNPLVISVVDSQRKEGTSVLSQIDKIMRIRDSHINA